MHFEFQSTRPVRGGTLVLAEDIAAWEISIHPPRAGRDNQFDKIMEAIKYFNPPAPCGAGLQAGILPESILVFQSTRPVRGGTDYPDAFIWTKEIFQSTRPVRGGTKEAERRKGMLEFQSTRPVRGGTTCAGWVGFNQG